MGDIKALLSVRGPLAFAALVSPPEPGVHISGRSMDAREQDGMGRMDYFSNDAIHAINHASSTTFGEFVMKFKQVFVGACIVVGVSMASATTSVSYDSFVLEYNEDTLLGAPSFSFSGGAGLTGFGWWLPSDIQVISTSGSPVSANYLLPSFTITAKPGWILSGPLGGLLGNVVFNEVGDGATTSMFATAEVSMDEGTPILAGGAVDRSITTITDTVVSGFYRGTGEVGYGSFSTLSVSNAKLNLTAQGGIFASIIAQPQNVLEFSLTAAPVPEPEAWALLMAGLGLVGYAARRRSTAQR